MSEPSEIQQGIGKEAAVDTLRAALLKPMPENVPALPMFLGTLQEQHRNIYKTAQCLLAHRDALKSGKEREAKILLDKYEEFRKEFFAEADEFELQGMLTNYFSFFFRSLDRALLRDGTIDFVHDKEFANTFPGKGSQRLGNIQPARPPAADANMSARDRMRKTFLRATGAPDTFTLSLRNSLVLMKVKIPTHLQLIQLINNITTKLRGYGERFNLTSLHLERAGIGELLVEFCLDNLSYHSVKGITDPYELKGVILANDLPVIAQTLLAVSAPKGVNFHMYCLAQKCDWNENWLVDAANMLHHVDEAMPEERREVFNSLANGVKLSPQELAEMQPVYADKEGKPLNTIVEFFEGRGRIHIGVPVLSMYFDCYKRMADQVGPALRKLAVEFPSQKQYEEKRAEYMSGIRMGEYLQWFSKYELDPEVGEEGETEVVDRTDSAASFDEGLVDIFNLDDELYAEALQRVIEVCPKMTYSYVGILDNECPKCRARAEGQAETGLGSITPIDPILNFFDHTQMTIGIRASLWSLEEENLS